MLRDTYIRNKLSTIREKLGFVPDDKLKSLITQENVEQILRDTNLKNDEASDTGLDEEHRKLAEFVIKRADKIFAILLMEKHPRRIKEFFENELGNDILPISVNGEKQDPKVQSKNMHISRLEDKLKKTFLLEVWELSGFHNFFHRQWIFLSPILQQSEFECEFEFDLEIKLPWTPFDGPGKSRRGGYAEVVKRAVPTSHVEPSGQLPPLNHNKSQHLIAVKKLVGGREEKNAKREADALRILRTIESEHVIKAICYFKQQRPTCSFELDHYFVFPWADQGNLWEFWQAGFKREKPELGIDFLVWTFGQLFGLIDAVRMMHDEGLRHGDLKPENILCFSDGSQPKTTPVRLVITDVGLSKAHEKSTSERKDHVRDVTSTTVSTTRYQPPELGLQDDDKRVLSRCFDVWSAGCIFTEFLVWMLYGKDELVTFTEKTKKEYWEGDIEKPEAAKVRNVICEQLDTMTKDDNCINHPALVQLVGLIENNFLIIGVSTLDESGENKSSPLSLTGIQSSASTKQERRSKSFVPREWTEKMARITRVLTKREHGSGSNTTERRVSSSAPTSRYGDTSEQAAAKKWTVNTKILHGSGSNTTERRVSSSAPTSRYRDTSQQAAAKIWTINAQVLRRSRVNSSP